MLKFLERLFCTNVDVGLELPEELQQGVVNNNYPPQLDNHDALSRGYDASSYITSGRVSSPRSGSRIRRSHNITSNEDGELTPLLQSDASSDASDDNVSLTCIELITCSLNYQ